MKIYESVIYLTLTTVMLILVAMVILDHAMNNTLEWLDFVIIFLCVAQFAVSIVALITSDSNRKSKRI